MKSLQRLPIHQIDLRDETFSVNFLPDLQRLRRSIQTIGLIQPVLLKQERGGYRIVSGFRRLWVCQELGKDEVLAMVFEEGEKNDKELFLLSLQENLTTRSFNMVEKAMVLQKLISFFHLEPSEIIKTYLPLMSLEPNEKILNTFLALSEMEEEVKKYILKEEVSRSNIRLLARIDSKDRLSLIPFLSRLKLGENRLREVLSLLLEISKRDGKNIENILHRPDLQATVAQEELTTAQRTERVKQILLHLRHPRLSQQEEEFEKRIKSLLLPEGISIHHPPFFEGKGMKMVLEFESVEKYQDLVHSLSRLGEKKEFKELVESF